jgi:hypothetical protein
VEEKAATASAPKPVPRTAIGQVREALDYATPVMLGTVYFLTLYEIMRPKRA